MRLTERALAKFGPGAYFGRLMFRMQMMQRLFTTRSPLTAAAPTALAPAAYWDLLTAS